MIVPVDREAWTSLEAAQPSDFGYVDLEFDDFVPVRSERFCWLGGSAPVPSPVNWETVSAVRFSFRGGAPSQSNCISWMISDVRLEISPSRGCRSPKLPPP